MGRRKSAGGFLWSYTKKDKLDPYYLKTRTKKIYQYSLLGDFICEYENAFNAGIQFGDYASHRIIEYCEKDKGECFGFQWKYYKADNIGPSGSVHKATYQYDKETGKYLNSYSSAKTAADAYGVDRHAIAMACRKISGSSCGYLWSYDYADNYFNLDKGVQDGKTNAA